MNEGQPVKSMPRQADAGRMQQFASLTISEDAAAVFVAAVASWVVLMSLKVIAMRLEVVSRQRPKHIRAEATPHRRRPMRRKRGARR